MECAACEGELKSYLNMSNIVSLRSSWRIELPSNGGFRGFGLDSLQHILTVISPSRVHGEYSNGTQIYVFGAEPST